MFPYQSVINFFSVEEHEPNHTLFIYNHYFFSKNKKPLQVITYKGYSFLRTQTPHVHPMSFSFHRQSATKPSFQQLDIVQLSSPALLSYLQERGINTALAKRECREAHFTNNDKRYFAIAFPNISGRYEIRNRYFKGCIAPKEISHIRQSGEQRKACYVLRDS